MTDALRLRVIGAGRAGRSLAGALEGAGWKVVGLLGRGDPVCSAAAGTDVLVISTPDAAIQAVAEAVEPVPQTCVIHLSGAQGLAPLASHPRRGALHPLVSIPDPQRGAARLSAGAWFAIAGDRRVAEMVSALGGHSFEVGDEDRASYHAAACVASNHLVALLGQVERLARSAGVPLEPYLELARATLENVAALGPAEALTGPVARGDRETIDAHLRAIPPDERPLYEALVAAAERLKGRAG